MEWSLTLLMLIKCCWRGRLAVILCEKVLNDADGKHKNRHMKLFLANWLIKLIKVLVKDENKKFFIAFRLSYSLNKVSRISFHAFRENDIKVWSNKLSKRDTKLILVEKLWFDCSDMTIVNCWVGNKLTERS